MGILTKMKWLSLGKYIDHPRFPLCCCFNTKQKLKVTLNITLICINCWKLYVLLLTLFLKADFSLPDHIRMIVGTKSSDFSRAISLFIISSPSWSMLIPNTDVSVIPRFFKLVCTATEYLRVVPKESWKFLWIISNMPTVLQSIVFIVFSYLHGACPTLVCWIHQILWSILCVFEKGRYWHYLCCRYQNSIVRYLDSVRNQNS